MTAARDQIARRAAQQLAVDIDRPLLVAEVERCLDDQAASPPGTYELVSLSIAALVVSIASLAWTIYQDLKKPDRDALTRRIRVTITSDGDLDESERDRIIDAVVEETLQR